jgi:hypothetical protein
MRYRRNRLSASYRREAFVVRNRIARASGENDRESTGKWQIKLLPTWPLMYFAALE